MFPKPRPLWVGQHRQKERHLLAYAGGKRGVSEATPRLGAGKAGVAVTTLYVSRHNKELQQAAYLWAYACGENKSIRNNAFGRRAKTLSCSKQALHGHMWVGKLTLSETTPHVGGVKQSIPASMSYVGVCRRGNWRRLCNHDPCG